MKKRHLQACIKTLRAAGGLVTGIATATPAIPASFTSSPLCFESPYVISPPHDFSDLPENELLKLLISTDEGVRLSAWGALHNRWQALAEDYANGKTKEKPKEKGPEDEVDADVKHLLEVLKDMFGRNDALSACLVLPFTPPDRAHHTVVAKHLRTAAADSKRVFVRVRAALWLIDSFWVRGEAPDEESTKVIQKLMQECDDKEALYYLLWCMGNMDSDALPHKEALEKLRHSPEMKIAHTAKKLLGNREKKMDAAKRKKIVFLPLPS